MNDNQINNGRKIRWFFCWFFFPLRLNKEHTVSVTYVHSKIQSLILNIFSFSALQGIFHCLRFMRSYNSQKSTAPCRGYHKKIHMKLLFPFKRNRLKMYVFILVTDLFFFFIHLNLLRFYKHDVLKNSKTYKDQSIRDSSRQDWALSPSLFAIFPEPHAAEILQNNNIQGTKTAKENCRINLCADNVLLYLWNSDTSGVFF